MATLGTFASGQVLTAAELNAIGTWTTFTPNWYFASNAITASASYGRYTVVNDIVIVKASLAYSTAAAGGALRLEIPSAASIAPPAVFDRIGTASIYDVSVGTNYILTPYNEASSTTVFNFLVNGGGAVTDTGPFVWAIGDEAYVTLIGLKA